MFVERILMMVTCVLHKKVMEHVRQTKRKSHDNINATLIILNIARNKLVTNMVMVMVMMMMVVMIMMVNA